MYNIDKWSEGNFIIKDSLLKVNHLSSPSLLEIMDEVKSKDISGPVILRFPHLIKQKIDSLFLSFNNAIEENDYKGHFQAVFPLKVNPSKNFIKEVIKSGEEYKYGLEAGSKTELIIAISLTKNRPITVNGFKDKDMIELAFLASELGHDITVIIEGINELNTIVNLFKLKKYKAIPKIGIRLRLHSSGDGTWSKSSGMFSKFGLSSTELIKSIKILNENSIIEYFTMLHFHIGSQMSNILYFKKALREVCNIYAELINLGSKNLKYLNIGGGLAVEYGENNDNSKNYTLNEFTSDVVFTIKTICEQKNIAEPNIFTESGRFISASHSVLVSPVLEMISNDYKIADLNLKEDNNHPLLAELNELHDQINTKNAQEYLHDALYHLELILNMFDLGIVDLQDRSNAEILVYLIMNKCLLLINNEDNPDINNIFKSLQEKYLTNFSIFQSLPDYWALKQHFPVMPIHYLDIKPTRPATIWDITCDSDGEIEFNNKNPLYLHDINIENEDYYIAFFLTGAYQEALSMKHNLLSKPTEVTISFNKLNKYEIVNIIKGESINKTIELLDYNNDLIELMSKLDTTLVDILKDKIKKNSYLIKS